MSAFKKFLGFFKKKEIKHTIIDENTLKKFQISESIINELGEVKGENAKLKSIIGKSREREKDKNEEEKVKFELNARKKEIKEVNQISYCSLKVLFDLIKKGEVEYFTFDRSKKIAKCDDIVIFADGDIGLIGNKKLIMKGEKAQDMFQSVAGLIYDVEDNKIPINLDKDGVYVENIQITTVPEVIQDKLGRPVYTKARKEFFYKYVDELRGMISEERKDKEELELTIKNLEMELDKLKRENRVATSTSETARSELGQVEEDATQVYSGFRSINRELEKYKQANMILEDDLDKLQSEVEKLRDQAERANVELSFDDAMKKIDRIRDALKQKTILLPQELQKSQINEPSLGR